MENTLVVYIVGDNGASGRHDPGSYNEMAFINMVPEDYKEVLKQKDNLGTWKTHNHYPVGWAHAMSAPFQWVKSIASHYGAHVTGWSFPGPRESGQRRHRTQWASRDRHRADAPETSRIEQPSAVNGVAQKPIEA